jgi:hypothetical protein
MKRISQLGSLAIAAFVVVLPLIVFGQSKGMSKRSSYQAFLNACPAAPSSISQHVADGPRIGELWTRPGNIAALTPCWCCRRTNALSIQAVQTGKECAINGVGAHTGTLHRCVEACVNGRGDECDSG